MLIKLNSKFIIHNSRRGALNIALIITISLVLMIITLTLQALTLLTVRIARTSVAEKASFYAAEGLIYDSIARMNASFDGSQFTWPSIDPLDDSVNSMANININRKIDKDEPGLGEYEIDIQASTDQSTRRLVATLNTNLSAAGTPDTDILFLLESSEMMRFEGNEKCADWQTLAASLGSGYDIDDCSDIPPGKKIPQPLYAAQSAVDHIIDIILTDPDINASKIQTGLITFHNEVTPKKDQGILKALSTNHSQTQKNLYSFVTNSFTNLTDPIDAAINEFTARGRPGAKHVIILFSSGLPNKPDSSCPEFPDSMPNTCVTTAYTSADTAKKPPHNIFIYTVGFGITSPHGQLNQANINFAQEVLTNIASDPHRQYVHIIPTMNTWTDNRDLQYILAQILNHILSTPYFTIEEKPA